MILTEHTHATVGTSFKMNLAQEQLGEERYSSEQIPASFSLAQEQLSEMSDEAIFQMCRKYGSHALYWRQKFIGLLPEVYRRRIYEKKGFGSIFEFAKKLAGLSEEQVRVTLNIEKRFKDKPALHELLVKGEVSINKLSRIASITTVENQEILARQVKLLPNRALEILVRDEKLARGILDVFDKSASMVESRSGFPNGLKAECESGDRNGFQTPLFEAKSLHVHSNLSSSLEMSTAGGLRLADDVRGELFELQQKGIDINELLRGFLEKRKLDIAQEKEQIATEIRASSRYIPAKIKKLLHREHGTKCSIQTCSRLAETIHHTQRFALAGTHDPNFLAPLCREHHVIAHSIDVKFHDARGLALAQGP